jgi:hypothetical protein
VIRSATANMGLVSLFMAVLAMHSLTTHLTVGETNEPPQVDLQISGFKDITAFIYSEINRS